MAEEELILFECRMVLVPNIRDDKNKTENDLLGEINTFEQLPCMKICGSTPPQTPPPTVKVMNSQNTEDETTRLNISTHTHHLSGGIQYMMKID